jgi:hypothetical protein
MALITLAEVTPYINQSGNILTDNQTAVLTDLITKVGGLFDAVVGQALEADDYTAYLDGTDGDRLCLDHYPVNSITHLYQDVSRSFGAGTEINSSLYFITHDQYIQLKTSYFIEGDSIYKVQYNAGWVTIPENIKGACINECVRQYKRRFMSGDWGLQSIGSPEGTNTSINTASLMKDTLDILDSYKLRNIL